MIIRKSLCDMEDTDIRLSSSLGMTRSKMRSYLYILSFTSDIGISKIVSYFVASAFLWQSQRILKSPKIKPLLVARESTNSEASLTKSAAFRPFVLVIGTWTLMSPDRKKLVGKVLKCVSHLNESRRRMANLRQSCKYELHDGLNIQLKLSHQQFLVWNRQLSLCYDKSIYIHIINNIGYFFAFITYRLTLLNSYLCLV